MVAVCIDKAIVSGSANNPQAELLEIGKEYKVLELDRTRFRVMIEGKFEIFLKKRFSEPYEKVEPVKSISELFEEKVKLSQDT